MATKDVELARIATAQGTPGLLNERGLTKVYWPVLEKEAFASEARSHGQRESEYARFILNARKDPLLFLQLCRLRDPTFAGGLMGNPTDAGRIVEVEKQLAEATNEASNLLRDRHELEKRNEELERMLAEASDRARDLAAHLVDLARYQELARERAIAAGAEHEGAVKPLVMIAQAVRMAGRMTRKDLEAALVDARLSPADAASAVQQATRLGMIVRGADARLRLAKPAVEVEDE